MQVQTRPSTSDIPGTNHPSLPNKMRSTYAVLLSLLIMLFLSGTGVTYLTHQKPAYAQRSAAQVNANQAVLTYKNDTLRTGQDSNETILNTSNVTVSQFGKRASHPVDGYVFAQPLYMPDLTVNGTSHNVVFVATAHDSIYAFDADQASAAPALWHTSFINPPSVVPITGTDVSCVDANPQMGVLGTPVIDPDTGTLYAVAATKENGHIVYRLHALDITTGQERPNSPVVIQASVPGTGGGGSNGVIHFDPVHTNQRPGLLLLNGTVYSAWASYCDKTPYHGWILGYDAASLQQTFVYNASPNAPTAGAGIWQSGGGIAADDSGNIYVMTGNGPFDLNTGGKDAGNTFLKLNPQNGPGVVDYFTPFNQSCLIGGNDLDVGSSGPLLLPSAPEMIGVGKEGRLYVVDRTNLGQYHTIANACNNQNRTNVDHIVQELPRGTIVGGSWSTLAYWNGSNGENIYAVGQTDHMKAFKLTNGLLSTSPTSQSPESFTFPGGSPTVSSDGTTAGTGILWTIDPHAVLRAYDATNLSHELYNSNQNSARDGLGSGNYVKFTVPTIANGEAFVGTRTSLVIYSLLGQSGGGGGNGSLTGSKATPASQIYLNATGPTDWAHWGLLTASTFDHKAGVTPQISNFTEVGSTSVLRFSTNTVAYNWAAGKGTPDSSASNTKTGIYVVGTGNGFTITIPADTTTHTLKVYVGVFKAQGSFTASLSDNSATAFTDSSLQNAGGTTNAVYTITFNAASSGQTLTISFTTQSSLATGGYVSLQSATLQ